MGLSVSHSTRSVKTSATLTSHVSGTGRYYGSVYEYCCIYGCDAMLFYADVPTSYSSSLKMEPDCPYETSVQVYRNMQHHINLLKPTSYVMYQQFNIQQLYVLPTMYLCVFYLSENKQRLVPLTA